MNAKNVALALGTALAPALAEAATINVNSLADAAVPVTDGACTLREAIANANNDAATFPDCTAGAGADTITFSVTGTINMAAGTTFDIINSLTINGPGSGSLTIDAENVNNDATFRVQNGTVSFSGLTIANGTGSAIEANSGVTLNVANTTLSGNVTAGDGGGLYLYDVAAATITNSVITGNTAARGGGIFSYESNAVAITGTEISGNSATGSGGGLFVLGEGDLLIVNSTISGNTSGGTAGGLMITSYAEGTIRFTTIANNSAATTGGNVFLGLQGDLTIDHTIIANGTAPQSPDIHTAYDFRFPANATVTWSLIETPGDANLTRSNTITGADPQLGPLQNNGGPTRTMMPTELSPVVNAGNPAFTPPPSTDQRGLPRPVARVDIGAVETVHTGGSGAAIPTLTEWMLLALASALAAIAGIKLRP